MEKLVVVRGGGDLATGTIYKLYKSGFKVLVLEIENPSAIRRNVAFCEAVYEGSMLNSTKANAYVGNAAFVFSRMRSLIPMKTATPMTRCSPASPFWIPL